MASMPIRDARWAKRQIRRLTAGADKFRFTLKRYKGRNAALKLAIELEQSQEVQRDPETPGDPDWAPTGPRKKLKYKYSSRSTRPSALSKGVDSTPQRKPREEGEIILPTPYRQNPLAVPTTSPNLLITAAPNLDEGEKREINRGLDALCTAFKTFLANASDDSTSKPEGSRTLLSTCIRSIGAQREVWEIDSDQSIQEDSETLGDFFSYLETEFESIAGAGWRHIKEVMRACGIRLVQDTIKEALELKVLFQHHVMRFRKECSDHLTVAEEENLLKNIAPYLQKPADANQTMPSGRAISEAYGRHCERSSMQFQRLCADLSSGDLPLDVLALTAFNDLWNQVVMTLCFQRGTYYAAEEFAESILIRSAQSVFRNSIHGTYRMINPSGTAFLNLVSSLCINLLSQSLDTSSHVKPEHGDENTVRPIHDTMRPVHNVSVMIIYHTLSTNELIRTESPSSDYWPACIVLTVELMATIAGIEWGREPITLKKSQIANALEQLLRSASETNTAETSSSSSWFSLPPTFLNQLWAFCKNDPYKKLFPIIRGLIFLTADVQNDSENSRPLVKKFVQDLIIKVQENLDQSQCEDLVESIFEWAKESGSETKISTESGRIVFLEIGSIAYRWEEGISEWVCATPHQTSNERKTSAGAIEPECSEASPESPIRPLDCEHGKITNSEASMNERSTMTETVSSELLKQMAGLSSDDLHMNPVDDAVRQTTYFSSSIRSSLPSNLTNPSSPAYDRDEEDELSMQDTSFTSVGSTPSRASSFGQLPSHPLRRSIKANTVQKSQDGVKSAQSHSSRLVKMNSTQDKKRAWEDLSEDDEDDLQEPQPPARRKRIKPSSVDADDDDLLDELA